MEQLNGKKRLFSMVIKIILILVVAGVAFYVIYFKTIQGRVSLILSDRDIEVPSDSVNKVEYKVNSRVYFHILRKYSNLKGLIVSLEIEKQNNNNYSHYKKITYEIDKDFKKLHTFIPEEYWTKIGRYKIKVFIDNNLMASEDISIVE